MAAKSDKISALLKIIASNVVYYRKKLGFTQEELANRSEIDRTYIGYIENAKHNVTLGILLNIASALNIDIRDIFTPRTEVLERVSDMERINLLFPFIREYQKLANKYNINDIFQDNGGKHLQMLLITGLTNIGAREGNDAIDQHGREYELKSVNSLLTQSFSTHHHLNPVILRKYKKVDWIFAVYEGVEIREIYLMKPQNLAIYFNAWARKWEKDKRDINNPKIPLKFVREHGKLIFKIGADKQLVKATL
jgi:transcriptional regulator with XRE-family HTH domain